MPEQKHIVTAYQVGYNCDECGEAMVFIGYTATAADGKTTLYLHRCKNGHDKSFGVRYPQVIFSTNGARNS